MGLRDRGKRRLVPLTPDLFTEKAYGWGRNRIRTYQFCPRDDRAARTCTKASFEMFDITRDQRLRVNHEDLPLATGMIRGIPGGSPRVFPNCRACRGSAPTNPKLFKGSRA